MENAKEKLELGLERAKAGVTIAQNAALQVRSATTFCAIHTRTLTEPYLKYQYDI